ncbi:MAG: HAD family hydrolase [Brachybacterium tyrofermentans]|uniref:HAD family hydrolase n=1 Tax=Brachybacterium tyrofermentans TaxID=47848 RepID=A0ABW0FK15_9MICO
MSTSLQQLRELVRDHDIRAVVSDLDGVLRIFDGSLWSELDGITGTPAGTAYQAVLGHPFLDEVVRGRGTHRRWREHAASALVAAGSSPQAADAAIAAWLASPARIDQGVLTQLESLRAAGLGVFVLTNGTDRVPEELEELGMTPFLGPGRRFLLNTADLGAAKPDQEAYARAHARIEQELGTSLRPDQVAFLDDSSRHVGGAVRFGWRAVLHHAPSAPA